jgi:S-formylglutathione hydrolase FrmB
MKRPCFLVFFLLFSLLSTAGTVDTVSIFSNSMQRSINCVVIKPDNYKHKIIKFPVVYLLHGYGGSYSNCITRVPQLKDYADSYQVIIVCPDGALSSWYFDSPVDTAYKYETHITFEVVGYIDKNYRTLADKDHRAIMGLSMGGHGALFLALRHAEIFGAAGSISGGVELSGIKTQFDIMKRIGDTVLHAMDWQDLSVINLIGKYPNTSVKITIDCGTRDIFIGPNRRLHQKMLDLNIPHDYTERPGVHNWDYWRNSIPFQLLFFRKFFDAK